MVTLEPQRKGTYISVINKHFSIYFYMEIPEINKRVLQLIEIYTNRSVKKFAETIGIPQQTLNRLFNKDTRTGKYPVATTEILVSISKMYVDINANWLMTGRGDMYLNSKTEQGISLSPEPALDDRLLIMIKEKDAKIEEQAKQIGRLEAENEMLKAENKTLKKDARSTDAGGATSVAAVG